MRKTQGLIVALAAAIITLSTVSCSKEDNTLRYNNATMGNIVNGVFTSDQGNRFNIKEQTCPGKLEEMERAFIICDVLNNTEGAQGEYDVRLNYIAEVLTKASVPVSETEGPDSYTNDPLVLQSLWISGGYINLYITVPIKSSDSKPHELNLLHEYKDGVYRFFIRHDAAGEVLKEDGDNSGMKLANAYASFPISSIIKEDKADISIEWNSYIVNSGYISAKTKILKGEKEYTKSTFEQVPSTAATDSQNLAF